jgi:hypothetical protein
VLVFATLLPEILATLLSDSVVEVGMKLALEELADQVKGDMRMALNQMQYMSLRSPIVNYADMRTRLMMSAKDEDMSPFSAVDKLVSLYWLFILSPDQYKFCQPRLFLSDFYLSLCFDDADCWAMKVGVCAWMIVWMLPCLIWIWCLYSFRCLLTLFLVFSVCQLNGMRDHLHSWP